VNLLLDQLVRKYKYGRIVTVLTKVSFQNHMNPVHRISSPLFFLVCPNISLIKVSDLPGAFFL